GGGYDSEILDRQALQHGVRIVPRWHAACHRRFSPLATGAARTYTRGMSRRRTDPLDARARQLLRTLVARHLRDGEPVGSQTLARHAGLDVSPATIRNILSDLEEVGLLSAPHTSAGRVPTARGYRVFVDSLLRL